MASISLGVNIDHVATLRQARGTDYPDPLQAALMAERAGADSITLHLREDRRHIQEHDVSRIADSIATHMNLELAATDEMLSIACQIKPADCCLVPERREELTTEGGLDVAGNIEQIALAVARLTKAGIRVSLFIDPDPEQVNAAMAVNAPVVELHTGAYAAAQGNEQEKELVRVGDAARAAKEKELIVNAGHGLHYENVQAIAAIPEIVELNIGHAIVSRAVFDGFTAAVSEMKHLMLEARRS